MLDKIQGGGYYCNKSRFITGGQSMQKKCNKKIRLVSIMLAAVMVLSVLVPAPAVEAAGKPSAPKSLNCRVCLDGNMAITNYASIKVKNFPKGAKIKNRKSSNKKVLTISEAGKKNYVGLELLKAGKAVVSFDVVYKGKTTSLKTSVTVRKYARPCSSFKVGNKEYASKIKKSSFFHQGYKGKKRTKEKVSIKAAKGWKLNYITYIGPDGKEKKVKNKNYVKYDDGSVYMIAYFQNKKTKEIQTVQMNFYPAF